MRVFEWLKLRGAMKVKTFVGRLRCLLFSSTIDYSIDRSFIYKRFEFEHLCWDPKDGDLCLNRMKPGETLVEVRNDSDVQIDREIWV